nr:site-2 protease family protein [Roseomonas acroporae]
MAELLPAVVATVLAVTLHEAAHGYAALALGDSTAKQAGRLSLNPLRHVDPVGTILLPGFLLVVQLLTIGRVEAMFGWAKPVPVNPLRFQDPRRGMMLVAMAGPLMNFLLAWLGGLAAHPVDWLGDSLAADTQAWLYRGIALFILANLVLGLFNLLPIPPLDGGRILVGLLPLPLARQVARLERAGIVIVLLGLLVLPRLIDGFDPLGWLLRGLVQPAFGLVLLLSGNGSVP